MVTRAWAESSSGTRTVTVYIIAIALLLLLGVVVVHLTVGKLQGTLGPQGTLTQVLVCVGVWSGGRSPRGTASGQPVAG
jgi:hypothetical protein